MRVLIAEDDFETANLLYKNLLKCGYRVDMAHYGSDALSSALASDYDIIILDIIMPGMDGREVIKKLRERGNLTPVIFVSALGTVEERVEGLKLGADDYLVKPFSFAELDARIQSILRRKQTISDENVYVVDDLEVDLLEGSVKRQGNSIHLSPTQFKLLTCLMKNCGQLLSRDKMVQSVWNLESSHDTNVVDSTLCRLREKVDGPYINKLIHSIKGVGYVLEDRS